ncbi:septum site-determining protein MinD [Candidatus Woesearchaeota archaeon]|nr:MAG: septum site-determining protein MinD [Candidatus Woesearchaeota archaeon]
MTRVIAVLAGKGGTGKTTTSIALGSALTYFGKDVIIVDTNLTTPNLGIHLGVPVVPINLHDVLQGKNKVKEAVYVHPQGLKIVPASISLADLQNTNPKKLPKIINELKKLKPDFILLDGAAGLGNEAYRAIEAAEELIIVTNPEMPAITDALKTITLAEKCGKDVLGVVLTKTESFNYDLNLTNIETILEKPIISIIPHDKAVREALVMKDSVVFTHPKSKPAIAYKKLAASLTGMPYLEDVEETNENFITRFIKKILH